MERGITKNYPPFFMYPYILPYNEAELKLREADVLLFKSRRFISLSTYIAKCTDSPYSHVGIAHCCDNRIWMCLEFAEFNKSRAFPISKYAKKRPGKIDVFRPVSKIVYSNGREIIFNDVVARNITCLAEHLVGESYGYSILYKLFARLIPGFNWIALQYNDNIEPKYFVCSTLVTYTYRKYFTDLVKFLPDEYTKPADIARSPLLEYQFTI